MLFTVLLIRTGFPPLDVTCNPGVLSGRSNTGAGVGAGGGGGGATMPSALPTTPIITIINIFRKSFISIPAISFF
jgi:hypothetical protein